MGERAKAEVIGLFCVVYGVGARCQGGNGSVGVSCKRPLMRGSAIRQAFAAHLIWMQFRIVSMGSTFAIHPSLMWELPL